MYVNANDSIRTFLFCKFFHFIHRDLFASVRDVVGGRAGSYESKLKEARDIAMDEMKELAKQKGANA
ncbi:heavy metal-binding domain-containing protein, partial [Bacillus sp. D-CC]